MMNIFKLANGDALNWPHLLQHRHEYQLRKLNASNVWFRLHSDHSPFIITFFIVALIASVFCQSDLSETWKKISAPIPNGTNQKTTLNQVKLINLITMANKRIKKDLNNNQNENLYNQSEVFMNVHSPEELKFNKNGGTMEQIATKRMMMRDRDLSLLIKFLNYGNGDVRREQQRGLNTNELWLNNYLKKETQKLNDDRDEDYYYQISSPKTLANDQFQDDLISVTNKSASILNRSVGDVPKVNFRRPNGNFKRTLTETRFPMLKFYDNFHNKLLNHQSMNMKRILSDSENNKQNRFAPFIIFNDDEKSLFKTFVGNLMKQPQNVDPGLDPSLGIYYHNQKYLMERARKSLFSSSLSLPPYQKPMNINHWNPNPLVVSRLNKNVGKYQSLFNNSNNSRHRDSYYEEHQSFNNKHRYYEKQQKPIDEHYVYQPNHFIRGQQRENVSPFLNNININNSYNYKGKLNNKNRNKSKGWRNKNKNRNNKNMNGMFVKMEYNLNSDNKQNNMMNGQRPDDRRPIYGTTKSRSQRHLGHDISTGSQAKIYDVPQIECPSSENGMDRFSCPTRDELGRYLCIDDQHICDGYFDCPHGEDEERISCMFYKSTKAHLDVLADYLLQWARGQQNM